jgi:hypothetical protein
MKEDKSDPKILSARLLLTSLTREWWNSENHVVSSNQATNKKQLS